MSREILFTVGPVQMYPDSLEAGGRALPYFRTEEFSQLVLECEKGLLDLARAPEGSRCAFLTLSGSGAMEAVVSGAFGPEDRVLIIDGGTFGHRFAEISDWIGLTHDVLTLEPGTALTREHFADLDLSRYTGLLVNAHETSTGVLYDLDLLAGLCKKHGLVLVVDAVSAFLCDELDMGGLGIDYFIFSSQKALALAPGLSMVAISPRGQERLAAHRSRSYYMDLTRHLADGTRGQTPFTPAVGVFLQLQARLRVLLAQGPIGEHCRRAAEKAGVFRAMLPGLPLKLFAQSPSNALTSLTPVNARLDATQIFQTLKTRYGLFVTPNGGALSQRVFRVGHMGNLDESHYQRLAEALREVLQ